VADFEVTGVEPGTLVPVVLPLPRPIAAGAKYRKHAMGQWHELATGGGDAVASAPGDGGACPPPGSPAYQPGLAAGDGCVQLMLMDGGPNDADGLANGVIRDPGGVAVPISLAYEVLDAGQPVVDESGEAVMMRLRFTSESGDVVLRSLTLQASGSGDDRTIEQVRLIVDADGDGARGPDEGVAAEGQFDSDDGDLQLSLSSPLEIPAGSVDVLVTYRVGEGLE
jgi:hypothetical protein